MFPNCSSSLIRTIFELFISDPCTFHMVTERLKWSAVESHIISFMKLASDYLIASSCNFLENLTFTFNLPSAQHLISFHSLYIVWNTLVSTLKYFLHLASLHFNFFLTPDSEFFFMKNSHFPPSPSPHYARKCDSLFSCSLSYGIFFAMNEIEGKRGFRVWVKISF